VINALPKLGADDIAVDQDDFTAIASFVFADGARFPLLISRHTLLSWKAGADQKEITEAIVARHQTLAQLAASARAAGKRKLRV
jgi:hypothetical protein